MTRQIVVIGVGNPWRADDAVGWAVADEVGRRVPDTVEVVHSDGEPARLLDAWRDAERAVVVDGVRTGAEPGTTRVWSADALPPVERARSGSHRLGVADALALGEALGCLPRRLSIVGVEVDDVGPGDAMTPAVVAAVGRAAELVMSELARPAGQ